MSKPYAEVIGDPIAHSKSPLIHRFWLAKLGLNYDYKATHVFPQDLESFLSERRLDPDWCGCNVTIPHKKAVLAHVDQTRPVSAALGASNCIIRQDANSPQLIADNTDWSGFLEPLHPWARSGPTSKFAYVIGNGGAALAISYALDRTGFTVISIARDTNKALALRQRLELFDDDLVIPLSSLSSDQGKASQLRGDLGGRNDHIDCLVNTTPLGMNGFPALDVDLSYFPEDMVVYDIVYDPLETPLLRQARRRGMPTIDGLGMLIGQAAGAFEKFFATEAPRPFQHSGIRSLEFT